MATTVPRLDRLDRIVTIIDLAVADRGWHGNHVLIGVEDRGADAADIGLAVRELTDGAHPVDELLGFCAPSSWTAIGAVTYGWAAPVDEHNERPSRHPSRCRARVTSLVDRCGREVVTTTLDDGRVIDDPGVSVLADVLRRCMGAPTAPPPPVGALADVVWLSTLLDHPASAELTWPDAQSLRPTYDPPDVTWTHLRNDPSTAAAFGDLATWMDDGMFARWLLAGHPPVARLLALADEQLPAHVARRLRAQVEDR